ncbi:MAG: VOC family protein [Gemmatimonadota bacterium]
MCVSRFCRYDLRTTDVEAARAFYQAVFGPSFWSGTVRSVPLPEAAAARGAPPHWLGHISTADPEGVATRIVELGGIRLGPVRHDPDGTSHAPVRDPFGAVLAIGQAHSSSTPNPVAWHLLHSTDERQASEVYADLFGWTLGESEDLAQLGLRHRPFTWDPPTGPVGGFTDAARQSHIHTQWLYCFRVGDLERAASQVLAEGGTVLEPSRTPLGVRVAGCEDAQGAAFALMEG